MRVLARWCFRHKFVVLGVWVAALLVLGGLSASAGTGYTDSFSLPGTESTTALNLLTANFNTESTDTNQVVFAAGDVNDPATKARIEKTLDAIAKGPHVERVDSPFAQGAAARQISKDGTVAFANVHMDGEQPIADVPKSAYDKLIATAEAARGDGLQVELGGSGIQQASQAQGGGPSEFIGFIAAAVVLAIAFGSLWATLLPLITAVFALGCGLALIGLLAHAINIATFAPIARHAHRPRRRDRLRAVRRDPPSQRDHGGPRPRGGLHTRAEHVRPGGAVRGRRPSSSRCSGCSCSASASSTASPSLRRSSCSSR